MKKTVAIILSAVLAAGIAGCTPTGSSAPTDAATVSEAATETTTTEPATEAVDAAALFREAAGEYICTTGTHGGTRLVLTDDGKFTGMFEYTYIDDPAGAAQPCYKVSKFNGELTSPVKMNDHQYALDVGELSYRTKIGTSETKGRYRYEYTLPEHIQSNDRFYLYLPGTPMDEIPDDALKWLHWERYVEKDQKTLPMFILYNRTDGSGFSKKTEESGVSEDTAAAPETEPAHATETPDAQKDLIHNGLWLGYSEQSLTVYVYQFGTDNKVTKSDYDYMNGEIKPSGDPKVSTYRVENGNIYIATESDEDIVFTPTEKETELEYIDKYALNADPSASFVRHIYHHDEMPDLETLNTEGSAERNRITVLR